MSRLGLIVAFLIVMGWVARFDGVTYQFRRFDRLVGVGGRAMRSRVCRAVLAGVLVALATNAATATANAATYGYDGSATACVGSLASGVGPQQSSASPGASTTPVANFVATNTGPVSKGPIADVEPSSLTEQLTLDEARSGLGRQIMENLGDEPRLESCYGAGEWVKMEWTHRAPTGNVTVHWFRNLTTGQNVEFKFK